MFITRIGTAHRKLTHRPKWNFFKSAEKVTYFFVVIPFWIRYIFRLSFFFQWVNLVLHSTERASFRLYKYKYCVLISLIWNSYIIFCWARIFYLIIHAISVSSDSTCNCYDVIVDGNRFILVHFFFHSVPMSTSDKGWNVQINTQRFFRSNSRIHNQT